jgi:hypothetical protein
MCRQPQGKNSLYGAASCLLQHAPCCCLLTRGQLEAAQCINSNISAPCQTACWDGLALGRAGGAHHTPFEAVQQHTAPNANSGRVHFPAFPGQWLSAGIIHWTVAECAGG